MIVERPVVRQFDRRFAAAAARHVRAGGHAVVWETRGRARFVIPRPRPGDEMDLGWWALLDMGRNRWRVALDGPYRGLGWTIVPRDCNDLVRHRAERDSVWPGPTRRIRLDCLRCGACCKDNRVELERADIARFVAAGRPELARRPYARRDGDKVVLRLLRNKSCRHLGGDNKCAIYPIRPWACSKFPVGSECCLFSREDELGIVDGMAT